MTRDKKPVGRHASYFLLDDFSNLGWILHWTGWPNWWKVQRVATTRFMEEVFWTICSLASPPPHFTLLAWMGLNLVRNVSRNFINSSWNLSRGCPWKSSWRKNRGRIWNQRNRWRKDTLSKKGCLKKRGFDQFRTKDLTPKQYQSLGII